MGKSFSKSIRISDLSLSSQAGLRAQLGDEKFEKILSKEKNKRGRYTVSAKEQRTADGICFDSAGEREAYEILRDRVGLEHITLQPEFLLQPAFEFDGAHYRDIRYVADFLLGPKRKDKDSPVLPEHIIIDWKGHLTRDFKSKAKQFKYIYRAHIHEIHTRSALLTVIARWKSKP